MKKFYTIIAILGSLIPMALCAQPGGNSSFNWKFEEANKLMEEKLFNQAAEIWKQMLDQDPDNANLNYKLGYALFNTQTRRAEALPFLERAAQLSTGNVGGFNISGYDPFDPQERNSPPETHYYLGRAYHLNNQFDKADASYQRFIDEVDEKHIIRPLAVRGKEQTANARTLRATPLSYQVSNVGGVINSEGADFSPVLSVDGNALFFTSRRIRPDSSNKNVIDMISGDYYENIYVSYKDREGNWQAPELLNINPAQGHMASINVSADGQTLYIYRSDEGDGNIYESKLVGELWSDPVKMGSDINTKSWETHGALTADGNTFYFISDRKEGEGGRDIYRVVRLPNGEWSKAQNLGNTINTQWDEDGVFIHPNGRTMYFSSVGHNSMGGFDIFLTELNDDGTWTTPQNLGYPLNTTDDDVFFITTADGRRGYFSSDKMGGRGEKDVYFVDLPSEMESEGLTVLKGFIIPPPGESLHPSTILYVTDKTTGEVKSYKPRQRDGVYVAILPPCREYNLDYRVNDVTVHSEDIFVECESAYQEINKEIYLNPVSLGGPATIADLPKGAPPGAKETGEPVPTDLGKVKEQPKPTTDLTDAEKEKTPARTTPSGTYVDEFTKYFAYNMKDIDANDAKWTAFIDKVVQQIDANGKANIVIEASASKVPTKTFGTNENLSRTRMEEARQRLVDAVKARGKNADLLMLEAVNNKVLGPRYAGDPQNTEKYGKYQYVTLKVR